MALVRDAIYKPPLKFYQIVKKEIDGFNLKIVKRLLIKFDPFRKDVKEISNFIHKKEVQESNPKLQIKTEILTDRSEQTITFDLTNGQTFIFKCANLKSLEILRLINTHITPLSPVEEPVDSEGYNLKVIDSLYSQVPAFTDIFDEETWYIFAFCFVVGTVIVAFIISRFVTIKPVE
ncbi:mitochondrial 50S ribosomal protein L53, putative [Pediculus humanus corporis]|uniref:Large ribosomal subunit protein mL53 n=1 Tax=Pediculus humanus subsp. corporis TaxID=121224 RepID=E0W4C2_PEDHC|nr:mitochondrial 50S ribosomal protein L53, putative [Pediculus humanus corporis]EEB20478.1 mitochondrial 50S ribosomal protein L53, putative [Pediculus humanus corporis]